MKNLDKYLQLHYSQTCGDCVVEDENVNCKEAPSSCINLKDLVFGFSMPSMQQRECNHPISFVSASRRKEVADGYGAR